MDDGNTTTNSLGLKADQELKDLTSEADWLSPFRLPDGRYTRPPKKQSKHSKDFAKTRMIRSFDVTGMSILDIGCSEGMYSFYLADQGADVVGIDIDEKRIRKANFIKKTLGFSNVRFESGNILDPKYRVQLTNFDLILAWGFLHRIPDPFNTLITLGTLCNAISLEWRAPAMLFPIGFSGAVHSPRGVFEWKNVEQISLGGIDNGPGPRGSQLAYFWHLSPGAVAAITGRIGFNKFTVSTIKNEANILRVSANWMNFLLRYIVCRDKPFGWTPSRRVHMLAEKQPMTLQRKAENKRNIKVADWDGRF